MKRMRWVLILALVGLLALTAGATERAFMGFDEATQKMYAVVVGDQPFHAQMSYAQSNPDGYIGNDSTFATAPVEVWGEAELSPLDPDRFTDIPDGVSNVITAYIDIFDETGENFLYQMIVRDTLVANVDGAEGFYTYVNPNCTRVLPDSIRINSSFCATICHGSYIIPISCESPGYTPDLLEVTVTPGCSPELTECDQACTPIDGELFSWFKRVYSGCHLYLTMTYCGFNPGCVCIWRSDFYLPVNMVPGSFQALGGANDVTVRWATASEGTGETFVVTRAESRDGTYSTIYSTPALGSAGGQAYAFTDRAVEAGQTYFYKLHVTDANGNHVYNQDGATVIVSATPGAAALPVEYSLGNFPNPFNSQTTFTFTLPLAGHATLKVYDLLGREVATVVDRDLTASTHSVHWSADGLAAGVYMYTLTSGAFTQTKKLLYIK